MKWKKLKLLRNEQGISLVEVVASVVILTFIILSFYYVFVQSAKTTKTSEDIIDATYIAQTEMEKFYNYSIEEDLPEDFAVAPPEDLEVIFSGYIYENKEDEYFLYKNDTQLVDYWLQLKIKQDENYNHLTRIILRVYDKNDNTLKAQMETTLDWGS